MLSLNPQFSQIERDLSLARQGTLSSTSQKHSTGLASRLAKPYSTNMKNRDEITLSLAARLSADTPPSLSAQACLASSTLILNNEDERA